MKILLMRPEISVLPLKSTKNVDFSKRHHKSNLYKSSSLIQVFWKNTHFKWWTHIYSGAKKYFVSHWLCKFSYL